MSTKIIQYKSAVPFLLTGMTWIFYSFFFKLYRLTDFLIIGALSAIVFVVSEKLIKPKQIEIEDIEFSKSGDKIADEILGKGREMMNSLAAIKEKIHSPEMTSDIAELYKSGEEIYSYVSRNPGSAATIRKFSDYYFPETLKILGAYAELDQMQVQGENVDLTKKKIEGIIDSMISAFKKQLDNLLYDKTFDVRTDIDVLETLLAEEGIGSEINLHNK